jgi:hypothetical protein
MLNNNKNELIVQMIDNIYKGRDNLKLMVDEKEYGPLLSCTF